MIDKGSKNHDIPRFLLKVYEKEKAWLKAIEVAKSINKSGVTTLNHDIANYFSELADDMYQLGQYDQMQEYLDQAFPSVQKIFFHPIFKVFQHGLK